MGNNLKKLKILCLISILFIVFVLQVIIIASPLKKGIHEIKNFRDGGSIFVNETGKIILKSDPNVEIGAIKDLFTNEISMLYKTYEKLYENADYQYDDNGYEMWERKYEGLIPEKTEYYDLVGNKINIDKEVIAIVGEKIILKNGNIVNMLMNNKYRLEGIKNESTNILYTVKKFTNKILVGEIENIIDEKNEIVNIKWVTYVYDINLKLIKKFDEYIVQQAIIPYEIGGKNSIMIEHLEKYGKDEYGNYDTVTKSMYLDEDLDLKDKSENEKVSFSNDEEKLKSKIFDGDKTITLYDVDINKCQKIVMGNKHYYYVNTTYRQNYIYNEKGNRVRTFPKLTDTYDIMFTDEKYIVIRDKLSETISVYDDEFKFKTKLKYDKKIRIKSVLEGKYYLLGNNILYNKEFVEVLKSSNNIKVLFNKYIFVTGENSKVYDSNLKEIKSFGKNITNVNSILINNNEFFSISGKSFSNILDLNFNEVISQNKWWDNKVGLVITYNDDEGIYEYDGKSKHIVLECENIEIYDLNFRKIEEIKLNGKQKFEAFIEDDVGNEYIVFNDSYYDDTDELNSSYSLYKIGKGYLLKDFYYIGDLKKDYFTYLNGFYYGLMDYDLNILCQYSIFDKIDEDKNMYWEEW